MVAYLLSLFQTLSRGTSPSADERERGRPANREPTDIRGTIKFTDDTDYWQANAFKFGFQNVTTFFKLGGEDVFIYGGVFLSLLFLALPLSLFSFGPARSYKDTHKWETAAVDTTP